MYEKKTQPTCSSVSCAQVCKNGLSTEVHVEEFSCHFHKTKRSNILQNKIGQVFFFFVISFFKSFKEVDVWGFASLLIRITNSILLLTPKPVFSALQLLTLKSDLRVFFGEQSPPPSVKEERNERRGMSPNQCQNTPFGCYLQTRALDASRRPKKCRNHGNPNKR